MNINSQQQLFQEDSPSLIYNIIIEPMMPVDIKNGGANLSINYSFAETPFGKIIIASTRHGICHIAFCDDKSIAITDLKVMLPNAAYHESVDKMHQSAVRYFDPEGEKMPKIVLHISGTTFQFEVWNALLTIPTGHLSTYSAIANRINRPKAARAVGAAIGKNPVALLISCHRVVQANGKIGGYMWGANRKYAIIASEAAYLNGVRK